MLICIILGFVLSWFLDWFLMIDSRLVFDESTCNIGYIVGVLDPIASKPK